MLKFFFIGDIVGRPGREIVNERVGRIRSDLGADFVIANGENIAAGAGITEALARGILATRKDGKVISTDSSGFAAPPIYRKGCRAGTM